MTTMQAHRAHTIPAAPPLPEGPDDIAAAGTRRRLQALVAIGWSLAKLADRMGVNRRSLDVVVRADAVHADTAARIRDLYDRLWDQPPPSVTAAERVAASRARDFARARRWPPPQAWDDDLIDLPDGDLAEAIHESVIAMDDRALRAWRKALYAGDPSPTAKAASAEYNRRRYWMARAAQTAGK